MLESMMIAERSTFNRSEASFPAAPLLSPSPCDFNRTKGALILLRRLFLLLARHRLSKLISTLALFVGSPSQGDFHRTKGAFTVAKQL